MFAKMSSSVLRSRLVHHSFSQAAVMGGAGGSAPAAAAAGATRAAALPSVLMTRSAGGGGFVARGKAGMSTAADAGKHGTGDKPFDTGFLGTPTDREELLSRRPISPHLFPTTEGPIPTRMHFKLPVTALASITNRVTGVGLTAGFFAASGIALTGDLTAAVEVLKADYAMVLPAAKFVVAFPLVYHTLGGLRHIYWDFTAAGFDLETMRLTSQALFGVSIAGAGYLSLLTI